MIKKIRISKFLFALFVFILTRSNLLAQGVDSAGLAIKKTTDSLKSIPLIREIRSHYKSIGNVDSSATIVAPISFFGLWSLNNYGSPVNYSRELYPMTNDLNIGFHYADFFYRNWKDLHFIKSNKTYVELLVSEGLFIVNSQSGLVDNLNASAFVTKNFARHIDLNFGYDRINQKGIYQNSRNFLGRLNAQIQYQNPNDRFTFSLGYCNDVYKFQNSGGILDDSLLDISSYRVRESIPVHATNSSNNIYSNQYFGTSSYRLSKDSMFFNPNIYLQADYKNYKNEFFDLEARKPNQLYGTIFEKDTNGIERSLIQFSSSIQAGVNFLQSKMWNIGLQMSYGHHHLLQDSSFRSNMNVLVSQAVIGWQSELSSIVVKYSMKEQQLKNLNHLSILGSYFLNNKYKLHFEFEQSRDLASLLEQKLYVNNRPIWENEFNTVLSKRLTFGITSQKKYFPKAYFRFGQIQNLIYLDSNVVFHQSNAENTYVHFELDENLSFGNFGTQHKLKLIRLYPDPAGWSGWNNLNTLFWQFKWGKNSTRTRIAAEFEWVQTRMLNGYNPLLGLYYPVKETKEVYGPFVGLKFEVQISDLQVGLSAEHLDSFWNSKRPSLILIYPVYDFGLRIQLLWRFLN